MIHFWTIIFSNLVKSVLGKTILSQAPAMTFQIERTRATVTATTAAAAGGAFFALKSTLHTRADGIRQLFYIAPPRLDSLHRSRQNTALS